MAEIIPGIYLERKKGIIGTGSTAKETVYRNFWMTVDQEGEIIHCVLLNNDFRLTSVTEKFPADSFAPPRFVYIPEGDKRYQKLKEGLPEKPSKKKDTAAPAPDADPSKSGKWWEKPQKEIQPGDFFSRDESDGKRNKPSSSHEALDIFSRPQLQAGQKIETKKKSKKSEVILKKNWWSS